MPTIADLMNQAVAQHRAGQLAAAEPLYRQVLQLDPNVVEAWYFLGLIACQAGPHGPRRADEAVACLQKATQLRPDLAPAHYNLGVLFLETERLAEAVAAFEESIRHAPRHAEAHMNLGVALLRQGLTAEAAAALRRALELKPKYPRAFNNLGVALGSQGQAAEAVACFEHALALQPDYAEAHYNLASAWRRAGRSEEAIEHFQRALQLRPDHGEAHHDLGTYLVELQRAAEAVRHLRRATELRPTVAASHNSLGVALQQVGELDEAVVCFQRALELQPDDASTLCNLGTAYSDQERYADAIVCFQRALERRPDDAGVLINLGKTLTDQGRADEAIACLRRASALRPDDAVAVHNLGHVLEDVGEEAEALACFQRAIALEPDYAEAHVHLGMLRLRNGDFPRGWPEYEWRWQASSMQFPAVTQPLWDGTPLTGRTILLHVEQGMGDTIQFIRFSELLKRQGATVLVECLAPLVPLLRTCPWVDRVLLPGEPRPPWHVELPLMSLPGVLGTTVQTVPASIPYLFAEPERIARWRERLAPLGGFKIGTAWRANPRDRGNPHRRRSAPPSAFAPLAAVPGVRLICLQKGAGEQQRSEVGERFELIHLGDFDSPDGAFLDTAAIMMNLDLIAAIDTSVSHLAGALGRPVWVAQPFLPDWRWLRGREDTPYYPTMRIFQQRRPGDWEEVFERMAERLQATSGARRYAGRRR